MPWSVLNRSEQASSLDVHRAVIEGAPVMLWLGDEAGKCIFLNRMQREFWGVAPDGLAGFDWSSTLHPDDLDALRGPFASAMANRTEMEIEARYLRHDGVYRRLRTSARPRFSESGRFLGMVGVNVDVTEQRRNEAALRDARDVLALATNASRLGLGTWDFVTGEAQWDARARKILDLDEADDSLDDWFGRVVEGSRASVQEEIWRDIRGRRSFEMIYSVKHRDGSERRVQGTGSIEHAEDGRPLRGTGLLRDVTEQWREQEFQKLVVGELNHRVKNLFALVNALVSQTSTTGRSAEEYRMELRGRLRALELVSGLSVDAVNETVSLRSLAEAVLCPHRAARPDAVRLEGPDIDLAERHGRMIGLALHELATNAVKYGALSVPGGSVHLAWRSEAAGASRRVSMSWQESGGPPVVAPGHQGFGSRILLSTLEFEGGSADLQFDPGGVTYRLSFLN